jgi:integrase/recombinase XerC
VSTPLPILFAQHLVRDRRRSVHTARAYRATGERLIAFLAEHWGDARRAADRDALAAVSAADLRAYLARRRGEGLTNASAARELSAVRAFLAWAAPEADLPRLRGPRVKKGLPRPISPDEAVALADDVAEDAAAPWIGARDWALLMLLYGAGLRIGEALALTGRALPLGATLVVTGKRDKTRIVPLLPQVRSAIEAYVAQSPWPTDRLMPLFRGPPRAPRNSGIRRSAGQGDWAT